MEATAPTTQSLRAAIGRHVGSLETLLRAHMDEQTYAGLNPKVCERMQGELERAVAQSAEAFSSWGYDAHRINDLCKRAWHADLGTAALKATFTNAVSSGLISLAFLAVTVPLSLLLPPLAVVGVALALTLAGSYRYGVHAWAAGLKIESQFDEARRPDGSQRNRFSACPKPATFGAAMKHAGVAETARSGLRLATTLPLQILSAIFGLFSATAPLASVAGVVTGGAAVAIGPLSNGLAATVSLGLRGRNRSMAPLLGVTVDRETNRIYFDGKAAYVNAERLNRSAVQRSGRSVVRLTHCFRQGFKDAFNAERQAGIKTREKRAELMLGSPAATKSIQSSLDTLNVAAHATGAAIPFFNVAAAVASLVGGGVLHAIKRPVSDHLSARKTMPLKDKDGTSPIGQTQGADSSRRPRIAMPGSTGSINLNR